MWRFPPTSVVGIRIDKGGYAYLLTYLLHGAESFLRSYLVLQLVKKFPAYLEPEGSSPYPQVPATCPYPEPTLSSPRRICYILFVQANKAQIRCRKYRHALISPSWDCPFWSLNFRMLIYLCGLHIYHRSVCTEYGHCMGLAARGMADLNWLVNTTE